MVASADGRRAVVFPDDDVKLGILLAMCFCGGILCFFWLFILARGFLIRKLCN